MGLGFGGPRLQLQLEEDHEAYWSWRDGEGIVHQLRPMWGMSIVEGTPHIIGWRPRCDVTKEPRAKHNTKPITCIGCLGWRGTTAPP